MNLAQQKDEHIGELTLRRRRAGEPLGPEGPAIEAHATSCADCRARIRALDDEQRRFEQEISFDRFAAGVERAARGASGNRAPAPPVSRRGRFPLGGALRAWMAAPVFAASAAAALVLLAWPQQHGANRIKGGGGGAAIT